VQRYGVRKKEMNDTITMSGKRKKINKPNKELKKRERKEKIIEGTDSKINNKYIVEILTIWTFREKERDRHKDCQKSKEKRVIDKLERMK
jgi:hypothetical protein